MPSRTTLLAAPLILLATATACTEDDGGTAPSLESLELTTDVVTVGALSTVPGALSFTDPDGDLESAEIEITDPAGAVVAISTPIQGVKGTTEGAVVVQLQILPAAPGTYTVVLTLVDAEGNESDPLAESFDVQA